MKNLVFTILSVLAFNFINAQQDLVSSTDGLDEYIITDSNKRTHEQPLLNADYIQNVRSLHKSKLIRNLENDIVNYNITTHAVYDNSEKATYKVSFKNNSSKAFVTYDNNGTILSSIETYKNINLPIDLRLKILKDYPEYMIRTNKVVVSYSKQSGHKISYKVRIRKNRTNKTLKFIL